MIIKYYVTLHGLVLFLQLEGQLQERYVPNA